MKNERGSNYPGGFDAFDERVSLANSYIVGYAKDLITDEECNDMIDLALNKISIVNGEGIIWDNTFDEELETLKKNHEQFVFENATPLDLDLFDLDLEEAIKVLVEKHNIANMVDTMGSFDENGDALKFSQSDESLIARHKTKLSSEFTSAWTQEDCNEFIEVGCSLTQDNEWANESI